MSACPACGSTSHRKSVHVMVLVGGGHRPARVCLKCSRTGVIVVPAQVAPVVHRHYPRNAVDTGAAIRTLTTYAKLADVSRKHALEGATEGKPEETEELAAFHQGRAEGYRGAIELLRGPK